MKIKILLLTLILTLCRPAFGQTNNQTTTKTTDTPALLAPFIILVTAPGASVIESDVQTVALRRHTPYYYGGSGYSGGYGTYSGYGFSGNFGPTYRIGSGGALVLQGSRGTPARILSPTPRPNWGQLQSGAPVLRSQNRSYSIAPSSGPKPNVGTRRSGAPVLRGNR
ncbi:MAG: hypothetical protein Q7R64_00720 [bacterium]|nr:hypothetical protein [bacterium]